MKILLTGGAGFIGSHIAQMYLNEGYELIIIDNLSSGNMDNIASIIHHPKLTFYQCDIRNKAYLSEIFAKHKPDIINLHAAQKSVPFSVNDPINDLEINGLGFLNLLSLAITHNTKKIIYISSGGVLSKDLISDVLSTENDFPSLASPYAVTKYLGEEYLHIYSKLNDFKWVSLRYGNVYGPRQTADGECGVIPIFINNIKANKPSKLYTYPDMPRGCTRDYIHVFDVVDVNKLVTKTIDVSEEIINVGSGIELPILDIYEAITKVYNSDLPIIICPPRIGDIKRSVLNINKVKKLLKWEPKVSFFEGLKTLEYRSD